MNGTFDTPSSFHSYSDANCELGFLKPATATFYLQRTRDNKALGEFCVATSPPDHRVFSKRPMIFLTTNFPRSGNKFKPFSLKEMTKENQVEVVRVAKGKATCAFFCNEWHTYVVEMWLTGALVILWTKQYSVIKINILKPKKYSLYALR